MNSGIVHRNITDHLLAALSDTPVIFLTGARQTGKSTLVNYLCNGKTDAYYYTMDDLDILAAAKSNPKGFVDGLPEKVIIDEVQRVPEILLPIKAQVDRNRIPGRFLLTGSANVLLLPRISESLAGRTEIMTLYPFSQGELLGKKESFLDHLFSDSLKIPKTAHVSLDELWDRVITGGYPEAVRRLEEQRHNAWFKSYITTLVQRDIADLSKIDGITYIPQMLNMLASRCGQLLNFADVSRSLQIPQSSLKRYFSLLESLYLVHRIQPWYSNFNSCVVKSSKIYLNDTGLISYLLGIDREHLRNSAPFAGHLLENFVVIEILKQISWSTGTYALYHYREHNGLEVDLVLESARGECVCIEIKAATAVAASDCKGLRLLKEKMDRRFLRGVLLYPGDTIIPLDENIHALPISTLWD